MVRSAAKQRIPNTQFGFARCELEEPISGKPKIGRRASAAGSFETALRHL
jgi:hypothetical protein